MKVLNIEKQLQLFYAKEYKMRSRKRYELKLIDFLPGFPIVYQTKLDEKLDILLRRFYGGGVYVKIDGEPLYNDLGPYLKIFGPYLKINVGNDSLIIDDLRERLNIDSKTSTCYVLVDRRSFEHRWIVAQEYGYVLAGLKKPQEENEENECTPF